MRVWNTESIIICRSLIGVMDNEKGYSGCGLHYLQIFIFLKKGGGELYQGCIGISI